MSGTRVISPNTTLTLGAVPTSLPFFAVRFQWPPPDGMPARIHSPFLSVTVFSCRVKSPTKSMMISASGTGLPAIVDHFAAQVALLRQRGGRQSKDQSQRGAHLEPAKQSSSHDRSS